MKASVYDEIELSEDVKANYSDEMIPRGTKGTIVEVYSDPQEGYCADLAIPDNRLVGEHRFENVILFPRQFEVCSQRK